MKRLVMLTMLGIFLLSFIAPESKVQTGIASYYHDKFNGRKTSSGEIFSNDNLTAAHKTMKLGTWVKVTNLKNDSVVIVKINDRLPKTSTRLIDLSVRAAKQLNFIRAGLTKVRMEVIDKLKD
jgi:rare lipoprotein A